MSSNTAAATPLDIYTASVPVFLRYLSQLTGLLQRAQGHAQSHGIDASALLGARLAPDMLPLSTQCEIATNFTLRAAFPLAGLTIPTYGEHVATFDGLQARVARATGLLQSLQPTQFAVAHERYIDSQAGDAHLKLPAVEFLCHYALPNFFFHLSTVYAILRHQGVPLGKAQFDGFHVYPAPLSIS
jgi:uncharacterized protein